MTREEAIEISRREHKLNHWHVDGEPIMTVQHGDTWLILWGNGEAQYNSYQEQAKLLKTFMKGVKNEGKMPRG